MKNISIGFRVHDLACDDEKLYAQTVKENGGDCVQLAPFKSFSSVKTKSKKLNRVLSENIYHQFQEQNINVRILGCYVNIIDSSEKKRRENLALFKNYMDNACYFDNAFVGTETGSLSKNGYTVNNFNERAFDKMLDSIYEIADYAEKTNVDFAIEPGINHPLYSVAATEKMIKIIGSKKLKIIFDLTNLINLENHQNQEKIVDDALEKFGDRICIFHLKDFQITADRKIQVVPFFKGDLEHQMYLKKIKEFSKNKEAYCTFESCSGVNQQNLIIKANKFFSIY
ncbi:MAG: sugar phosphate isomerase/epimerase [Liquorilactobacillus nagelii]|jgi:sugar phosphate isomerase/epimerase|uniref:sugar phosphate isomerase/epimerase family protein n=1 Tax=Liquorilactobacillus nagelii TaxID=82688 RepID=UPI00242E0B8B|nr:TIM barrel protein [Liquorilactobacillus nagelii]MCI1922444.1 sugar phosphate isomerase/epimerase [Liquorilactobacillus nagelii]MCI1977570.1 sugar phosphate isomerase/epimerase [Liquorilactobacillus nagelii]